MIYNPHKGWIEENYSLIQEININPSSQGGQGNDLPDAQSLMIVMLAMDKLGMLGNILFENRDHPIARQKLKQFANFMEKLDDSLFKNEFPDEDKVLTNPNFPQ